jgi:hypothetical protein
MWKCHTIYESRPRSVIVTLIGRLYMVPEVVSTSILEKIVSQSKISYQKV